VYAGDIRDRYNKEIYSASVRYKVPEKIIKRVILYESSFRRTVVSGQAYGLMQVKLDHFYKGEKWNNPQDNINAGARLLKRLNLFFNGDWHRTLCAYNMGRSAVVSRGIYRSRYSRRVLGVK